ncbi:MAG: glycosyltransferase, partial [Dissulfuribacterales bacterium]
MAVHLGLRPFLCLTSSFPRWPEDHEGNFVFQLVNGLLRHGWQAEVLTPHTPHSQTREEMQGVLVKRFRYLFPERLETVCGGGSAMVTLKNRPLEMCKLPPLLMSQFLHTISFAAHKKYSLIHAHWLIPQGFIAVLAARFFKIPTVVTVHGGDVFRLRSPFFNAIKRFTLSLADCITVNSPATRKAVLSLQPNLKNLYEIPMGIPDSLSSEHTKDPWANHTPKRDNDHMIIVFVGRLAAEKGVEDLLNAGRILIQKGMNIRLILVGDGQERQDFESISRTLGIEAHTEFIGALPHNQVLALLQKADVFVAPSRITKDGWQEAQGLSIAEAMAVGIPVVATRVGGIPSMVRHGETGLLVQPQSPVELAQTMDFLLSNREIAREMARRAQKFIINHCGQSRVTAAFADLFEKIVVQR